MELLVTEAGQANTHYLFSCSHELTFHQVVTSYQLPPSRPTMDASEIDWETINEQMPYDHSDESHARRREIWNGMNVNGNKFLSLAEVDKGVIDVRRNNIILERSHFYVSPVQVLGLEDVFDSKRAINEAFYFAKNSSPVSNIIIFNI